MIAKVHSLSRVIDRLEGLNSLPLMRYQRFGGSFCLSTRQSPFQAMSDHFKLQSPRQLYQRKIHRRTLTLKTLGFGVVGLGGLGPLIARPCFGGGAGLDLKNARVPLCPFTLIEAP